MTDAKTLTLKFLTQSLDSLSGHPNDVAQAGPSIVDALRLLHDIEQAELRDSSR